ncbi:biotin-dependent carboxyltransferase family protein [Leptospira interrogans]
MTATLRIVSPGLMTTLQDCGRPKYQRQGIPVSGAMDPVSLAAANLLVGNAPGMAALEIAYQGPTLTIEADSVRFAFVGGNAPIDILSDGGSPERLPTLQSHRLERGKTLRIGALSGSSVGYLAIEGGFDIAPFIGSLSTYVRGGLGGWKGRALASGDELPLKRESAETREEQMLPGLDLAPAQRIRVILGPQNDYITDGGIQTFLGAQYTVSGAADRMGMRLEGPALEHAKGFNIVSDGIAPGAVQIPGTGTPIILMADRQTTGGYPKVATVISADLAAVGRLSPGSVVSFEAVSIEAAEQLRGELSAMLEGLAARLVPVARTAIIDEGKLLSSNLVSGVIYGHNGADADHEPWLLSSEA